MTLTHGQMVALELMPKFGSALSMMGSSLIIGRLLLSRKTKLKDKLNLRILLAMSIFDIPSSLNFFLSSWMAPVGSPEVLWAAGNQYICSFQGFLGQVGLALPMYNTSLSICYYLNICHGFKEKDLAGIWRKDAKGFVRWLPLKAEIWLHSIPIGTAVGTAIAGLAMKLFAYAGSWCWIAPMPDDCLQSFYNNGVTTCQWGDNWSIYRWAFWYAPLWSCLIIIFVLQVLITRHVRGIELRSSTYEYERNARNLKQTREVYKQCVLFVLACYATWIFPTINRLVTQITANSYYPLQLIHAIIEPTQGLWNFLVYNHPRYLRYRKKFPEKSFFRALFVTAATMGTDVTRSDASLKISCLFLGCGEKRRTVSRSAEMQENMAHTKPIDASKKEDMCLVTEVVTQNDAEENTRSEKVNCCHSSCSLNQQN